MRTESYRSTVHNAERVFQAGCLLSSRIYCALPKDGAAATMQMAADVPTSWENATIAACVGNAMTLAETRVSARIMPLTSEDIKLTAGKIVSVCKTLKKNGIKAVPLVELCACLASF